MVTVSLHCLDFTLFYKERVRTLYNLDHKIVKVKLYCKLALFLFVENREQIDKK